MPPVFKASFFSTTAGQLLLGAFILVVALFWLVASIIALVLAKSLDQVQPNKQKATVGTAAAGVALSVLGIGGGIAVIYFGRPTA
jgi:uncharacterized membrane protein YfcA